MGKKRRILIIEDYPMLRIGLRGVLSQEADIEIAGETDNGRDTALLVAIFSADLVLIDLSLNGVDGVEAIADIKQYYPDTRILILTMHKADECVRESLLAGADGCILMDDAHDELCTAIRYVLNGRKYLSSGISAVNGYLDIDDSSGHGKGHNIHAVQHAIDWR